MSNIFVNGQAQTTVSALDRGILYGDSVFETIALVEGKALQLSAHVSRLEIGLKSLGINLELKLLESDIDSFLQQIDDDVLITKSVLRITITRGEQSRGYKPIEGAPATRILSLHSWPDYPEKIFFEGLKLNISEVILSEQPRLSKIKHGNRLEQVLAAAHLPKNYDDALMLNQSGDLIAATKGNVFIKRASGKGSDKQICQWQTPIIDNCGIDGITRQAIINYLATNNIDCIETRINYNELISEGSIESAFICNSVLGIAPIQSLPNIQLSSDGINECHKIREALIKQHIIA